MLEAVELQSSDQIVTVSPHAVITAQSMSMMSV